MPGKRFTAEKIINILRETEVLLSTGKNAGEVCRELNISIGKDYQQVFAGGVLCPVTGYMWMTHGRGETCKHN